MTTDKTPATLATVKHGGCVKLAQHLAARQPAGESDACLLPQIATDRMLDAGWPCGEMIDRTFDRQGAYADLVAAAPASARQPVGEPVAFQLAGSEPLWCLHVLGMDDVHPAPSKAHAEKAAAWHNEQFKDQAERLGISIEAKVVPWPHSAESHADGVAEFIPQWLIPQWQLDALEANAKQPAQAVDLGAVREALQAAEGLATVCASVDGYSREEVAASGRAMKQQFSDALAKIDSQAVDK